MKKWRAEKVEVDVESQALFFYACQGHMPPLPDVDAMLHQKRKRKWKREVNSKVVEQLVKEEGWKVVDGLVEVEDCFVKVPRVSGTTAGVFDAFCLLEKEWKRSNGHQARLDTAGKRVVALDGEGSSYMNLGTTVNRHGKGANRKTMEVWQSDSIQQWLKWAKAQTLGLLPEHVEKVLWAVEENQDKSLLAVDKRPFWQAVGMGRNVFLNAHTDRDATWSLTTVVSEMSGDDPLKPLLNAV